MVWEKIDGEKNIEVRNIKVIFIASKFIENKLQ